MRLTKDVFVQFDDICRSIAQAAEKEAQLTQAAKLTRAASEEVQLQPGLAPRLSKVGSEDPPEENSYASHIARGMAKAKTRG